jgi:hypothetical protein
MRREHKIAVSQFCDEHMINVRWTDTSGTTAFTGTGSSISKIRTKDRVLKNSADSGLRIISRRFVRLIRIRDADETGIRLLISAAKRVQRTR